MSDIGKTVELVGKVWDAATKGDVQFLEVVPDEWYCEDCKDWHDWTSESKCGRVGATAIAVIVKVKK